MPKNGRNILEQVIFAKTGNQIVELFHKMPETERQELAPFFLKQLKDFDHPEKLQQFLSERADEFIAENTVSDRLGLNQRMHLAIIATANLKEIEQVFRNNTWGLRMIDDYVEPILHARKPSWLSDFFIWSCEFTDHTFWPIYRRLCLDGVVERVLHETVIRAMFAYLPHEYIYHDDYDPASKPTSIVPRLEKNLDLLEHEVWRLFEFVSFPNNWSLASWDKENQWNDAISIFIEKEMLDKYRIMDGCFLCLGKAFTEQQAKWYAHLLERIPLTDEELQREQKHFLALLNNPNPTTSSLGLKIMERLFKSGLLDDKLAVTYLPSVLRESSKGKAKRGVALLDKLVKRTPALRHEIFHVLLEGLQHEAIDIQQTSAGVLLKYNALKEPAFMGELKKISPSLTASVRKLLLATSAGVREEPISSRQEIHVADPLKFKDVMAMLKNFGDAAMPVHVAATDQMIDAVTVGRLTPDTAIAAAKKIIPLKIVKISRWVKHLSVVSEQSKIHATFVVSFLEGTVSLIDKRELASFLELLYELCVTLGASITNAECRRFLETLSGSGKAAKLAKKLLEQ